MTLNMKALEQYVATVTPYKWASEIMNSGLEASEEQGVGILHHHLFYFSNHQSLTQYLQIHVLWVSDAI